jgi:hypothetical protein
LRVRKDGTHLTVLLEAGVENIRSVFKCEEEGLVLFDNRLRGYIRRCRRGWWRRLRRAHGVSAMQHGHTLL